MSKTVHIVLYCLFDSTSSWLLLKLVGYDSFKLLIAISLRTACVFNLYWYTMTDAHKEKRINKIKFLCLIAPCSFDFIINSISKICLNKDSNLESFSNLFNCFHMTCFYNDLEVSNVLDAP